MSVFSGVLSSNTEESRVRAKPGTGWQPISSRVSSPLKNAGVSAGFSCFSLNFSQKKKLVKDLGTNTEVHKKVFKLNIVNL